MEVATVSRDRDFIEKVSVVVFMEKRHAAFCRLTVILHGFHR